MDHSMRVLYVSPESLPFAKASGLAETAQTLARRRDAFWVTPNGTDEKTWDSGAAIYVRLYENALKFKRGGRHG